MQQVLFHIPFTEGFAPPDGVPVYGFGAMLFLTFVLAAMVWGPRRVVKVGLPKDKLQDLAIVLFLFGIAGARIVYMIQYSNQFPPVSDFGRWLVAFMQIWNGGIVFYGSVFGGLLGFLLFRHFVLTRLGVSMWKLADAIAPLIAFGLAVGRLGCYLNGCCWGQPVCVECQPLPLAVPALGEFPLLSAHARDQVCRPAGEADRLPQIRGLQTSTGFAIAPREVVPKTWDPRSVVTAVEPGSAAERAGLKVGDKVTGVNGQPNRIVVELAGTPEEAAEQAEKLKAAGGADYPPGEPQGGAVRRVSFDDPEAYRKAVEKTGLPPTARDALWEAVGRDWPRGRKELDLTVDRGGQSVALAFVPKTVPFFPTQLYETVSMLLLVFLLLAFQSFRRHDGQVLVLLMLGYAAHRFLNEAIRIEPTYAMGLTLSQWISVGIFAAGLVLELALRRVNPKLPPGEVPLSYGVTPAAA